MKPFASTIVFFAASMPALSRGETVTLCGNSAIEFGENQSASDEVILDGVDAAIVEFVVVDLGVLHDWVGDLQVSVAHEEVTVALLNRPGWPAFPFGCGGRNVGVSLRDDAADAVQTVCSPGAPGIAGVFRPAEPLSAFAGMSPGGDWTLTLLDVQSNDCGMLPAAGFCIHVTYAPDCNDNGQADGADIAGGDSTDYNANGVPDECDLFADADGDEDVDLDDFSLWLTCETGPGGSFRNSVCNLFDADRDEDVDLRDWPGFQIGFTGATSP